MPPLSFKIKERLHEFIFALPISPTINFSTNSSLSFPKIFNYPIWLTSNNTASFLQAKVSYLIPKFLYSIGISYPAKGPMTEAFNLLI